MKNDEVRRALTERYWRSNLRIMAVLLGVWALAGLGAGILFADVLNVVFLFGTGIPLGFWFAQQGSILVFVATILVYCLLMNRLDRRHHDDVSRLERGRFE
jgi:putative solute:sodium symporter small subunit